MVHMSFVASMQCVGLFWDGYFLTQKIFIFYKKIPDAVAQLVSKNPKLKGLNIFIIQNKRILYTNTIHEWTIIDLN